MNKFSKALSVVATVVEYTLCALCILLLSLVIFSKRDTDGAVKVLGYELRIVLSGSMEAHPEVDVSDCEIKSIKTGSLVIVRLVPDGVEKAQEFYSQLKVGDVLTFRYNLSYQQLNAKISPQVTVSHRIINIDSNGTGGYIIKLRGDNLSDGGAASVQIIDTAANDSPNYVIGKVTGSSYILGRIIYFVQSPLGVALLVITPCVIIIINQVARIARAVTGKNGKQE